MISLILSHSKIEFAPTSLQTSQTLYAQDTCAESTVSSCSRCVGVCVTLPKADNLTLIQRTVERLCPPDAVAGKHGTVLSEWA